MAHCIVPDAERVLDTPYRVREHGSVALVDYLGSDDRIARSAGASAARDRRQDGAIIAQLLRRGETAPFEQVVLTYHVRAPRFLISELAQVRTSRAILVRGREPAPADSFEYPAPLSPPQTSDAGGPGAAESTASATRESVATLHSQARRACEALLAQGVPWEDASTLLPATALGEALWQIDLFSLFSYVKVRRVPSGPGLTRDYLSTTVSLAARVCPLACRALQERTGIDRTPDFAPRRPTEAPSADPPVQAKPEKVPAPEAPRPPRPVPKAAPRRRRPAASKARVPPPSPSTRAAPKPVRSPAPALEKKKVEGPKRSPRGKRGGKRKSAGRRVSATSASS